MALNNVSDYQDFVNEIFFGLDQVYGGIDRYGFPVFTKILPEDYNDRLNAYLVYKQARMARPTTQELFPSAHGVNGTTQTVGGNPEQAPTEDGPYGGMKV